MVKVHEAYTQLRGDERYNPRFSEIVVLPDGVSIITGWMRPDSPKGVAAEPPLLDLPFRLTVPEGANYSWINFEIWRRLQSGETLWNLDFCPPPPPQEQGIGLGHLAVGGLLFVAAVALASNSRN
jgi:hypothetical protein